MLAATEVGKTYITPQGEFSHAIESASLTVREGEFVSVVGPSGCGKTTMLRIWAGLIEHTRGEVRFREEIGPPPPASLGIVFQSPALLPWRDVLENILLPADVLGIDRRKAKDRARHLLGLVQLPGVEHKYPGELSGGMQQRVSIARALLHDPPLLFMDEPFGALDALTREDLNSELQEVHMQQHKTVFFVTHSISEAVFLSDRVYVMSPNPGRVVAEFDIPLQRPRLHEHRVSQEFRTLERNVRRALDDAALESSREERHELSGPR